MAGVAAATMRANSPHRLFLLPPACLLLGWTYLVNDQKVSAIVGYLPDRLRPQLETLTGSPCSAGRPHTRDEEVRCHG
jgi:hypothetical protein